MTTATSSAALVPIQPVFSDAERLALAGFLAGYRGLTPEAYTLDLRQFTGLERGHRTLVITRKGGKVVTIPLAPRTARAIDLAVSEREDGPIFLAADGRRLGRHGAGRIVRRVARRAGISKNVGPHTLRHAFITTALDAGVPLRDVQEAASHADPRTTMRYDRARGSLDRHATYIRLSPYRADLPAHHPVRLSSGCRFPGMLFSPFTFRITGQPSDPKTPRPGPDRLPAQGADPPAPQRRCELCEHDATVTVHQVAALKHLGRTGPGQPAWAALMAKMRRKTLIVCAACHEYIHTNPVTHAA